LSKIKVATNLPQYQTILNEHGRSKFALSNVFDTHHCAYNKKKRLK